jgi:hypothetical protein
MSGILIIIRGQALGARVVHISSLFLHHHSGFSLASCAFVSEISMSYDQRFPCRMRNLLDKQIGALVESFKLSGPAVRRVQIQQHVYSQHGGIPRRAISLLTGYLFTT